MKPLDPLDLTRRLVDIESLTYNEGAVGEYLDGFLREQVGVERRLRRRARGACQLGTCASGYGNCNNNAARRRTTMTPSVIVVPSPICTAR